MNRLIITLTPFPTIEYIYSVESLTKNQVLPAQNVSLNILSKGVYSAQIIKILQEEPILISSLGGFVGKSIKHYLDKSKVKTDIVWTDSETPHQVKIMLKKSTDYYLLKSHEDFTMDKELDILSYKLKSHLKKVSTVVLSGKLPVGQSASIYSEWIAWSKAHNIKVILSTSQKEVWENIQSQKPYALFFTVKQLESLEIPMDTNQKIVASLAPILGEGLHYICVYLNNKRALVLSKNKYCLIESTVQLIHTNHTASSGAFLGALAIGIHRKYEQEKIAKLCLASALSADDRVNHKICTRKDIEYFYKKTKVKQIFL